MPAQVGWALQCLSWFMGTACAAERHRLFSIWCTQPHHTILYKSETIKTAKREKDNTRQSNLISSTPFPTTTLLRSQAICPGSKQDRERGCLETGMIHLGGRGMTEILQAEITFLFTISFIQERWDFSNTCPVMTVYEWTLQNFTNSSYSQALILSPSAYLTLPQVHDF